MKKYVILVIIILILLVMTFVFFRKTEHPENLSQESQIRVSKDYKIIDESVSVKLSQPSSDEILIKEE